VTADAGLGTSAEAAELSAGRIEGALFFLGAAVQQRPAVLVSPLHVNLTRTPDP